MADEEATQAPQEDVKPDIKPEVQHLTLTVVHQVSLGCHHLHPMSKCAKGPALPQGSYCS